MYTQHTFCITVDKYRNVWSMVIKASETRKSQKWAGQHSAYQWQALLVPLRPQTIDSDSTVISVQYKPTHDCLEQMMEQGIIERKEEEALKKDRGEDGQIYSTVEYHPPVFLEMFTEV